MGCFNLSGFYSHLPIEYGDRVGAILCVVDHTRRDTHNVISSLGEGFIPVCAPIYGVYNEYGCMENIDDSYTVRLFKEKIGCDFYRFTDLHYRNSNVTVCSVPAEDEFDNSAEYKEYLKKIVFFYGNDYEKTRGDKTSYTAEVRAEKAKLVEYTNSRYEKATVSIIYEHESVLKTLGENTFDGHIDRYVADWHLIDNINFFKDIYIDRICSLGECVLSDFDCSLYKLPVDRFYSESNIAAIKEIVRISAGLNIYYKGFFCPSAYAGQESDNGKIAEMYKTLYTFALSRLEK